MSVDLSDNIWTSRRYIPIFNKPWLFIASDQRFVYIFCKQTAVLFFLWYFSLIFFVGIVSCSPNPCEHNTRCVRNALGTAHCKWVIFLYTYMLFIHIMSRLSKCYDFLIWKVLKGQIWEQTSHLSLQIMSMWNFWFYILKIVII